MEEYLEMGTVHKCSYTHTEAKYNWCLFHMDCFCDEYFEN